MASDSSLGRDRPVGGRRPGRLRPDRGAPRDLLEVPKASALALLGPNGAGKTTLLKAISGQLALTAGTVEVGGRASGGTRPSNWPGPASA